MRRTTTHLECQCPPTPPSVRSIFRPPPLLFPKHTVIGKYPLLEAGSGEVFMYSSCTGIEAGPGVMSGDFAFLPGSIHEPTGPEFLAEVRVHVCVHVCMCVCGRGFL